MTSLLCNFELLSAADRLIAFSTPMKVELALALKPCRLCVSCLDSCIFFLSESLYVTLELGAVTLSLYLSVQP